MLPTSPRRWHSPSTSRRRLRPTKSMTAAKAATPIATWPMPPVARSVAGRCRSPCRARSWRPSPRSMRSATRWAAPCRSSRRARSAKFFTAIGRPMTGGSRRRWAGGRASTSRPALARRSCGTEARDGSRACEIRRNKLSFHKESPFLALMRCLSPSPLEPLLRTAHELTVENDGIADTLTLTRGISRAEVIREICVHLEPYQTGEKPITGETVIAKDLTIDSLAIMDMGMELEDGFDVSIPMSVVAEIHTVDQLADTIRDLSAQA